MRKLDKIDKGLIERIRVNPGMPMIEAGRPYLKTMSEQAIRQRLRRLMYEGYIRMQPITSAATLCYIGEKQAVTDDQATEVPN
jgi:hypothetical protein